MGGCQHSTHVWLGSMKKSVVEAKFKELEREACSVSSSSSGQTMKNNIDVLACKAEYDNQSGEYQKCSELTSMLVERDTFHSTFLW